MRLGDLICRSRGFHWQEWPECLQGVSAGVTGWNKTELRGRLGVITVVYTRDEFAGLPQVFCYEGGRDWEIVLGDWRQRWRSAISLPASLLGATIYFVYRFVYSGYNSE